MLREYEQLSYQEIADLRGAPLNTVRSQLFRARMALKIGARDTGTASCEDASCPLNTPTRRHRRTSWNTWTVKAPPPSRAAIGAHLASCAACQAIAAEQRGISEHAQAWTVGSAPASLQPPAPPRPGRGAAWRACRWSAPGGRHASVLAGLAAAAVVLLVVVAPHVEVEAGRLAGHRLATGHSRSTRPSCRVPGRKAVAGRPGRRSVRLAAQWPGTGGRRRRWWQQPGRGCASRADGDPHRHPADRREGLRRRPRRGRRDRVAGRTDSSTR